MLGTTSISTDLSHFTSALGFLAASLDELAQISDWQRDREVNRLEDHREPEVPRHQGSNE